MNYFDKELNILEWFRIPIGQIMCFPFENETCKELYLSLIKDDWFKDWVESSGKADPPPDFYNPKIKMMMDVMRVDDHAYVNERGKIINPVNQRESKIRKELEKSSIMGLLSNDASIIINAVTDLPEREDHNYEFYYENFKRVIKKHIESIPLYKKNHPGYDTVFFIFDESSGYVLAEDELQAKRCISPGEMFYCRPYLHFIDKRFVELFAEADIDYVIWYSPYKHFDSDMPELPFTCIYDVKSIVLSDLEEYPISLIMSTEA